MSKAIKFKLLIFFSIPALLALVFFCTSTAVGQVDNSSAIEQKLSKISDEEKKVLQNLFKLEQEIKIAEGEERTLSKELEALDKEIKNIEVRIKGEEASYLKKQEGLRQVMKTYQRMGPGSFLEIIMNSNSLSNFLRRLNTMRDFTKNTGELLDKIEESKEKLAAEKLKLDEALAAVEKKQQQAKEVLAKKIELKNEQEKYLASLKKEKDFYNNQLLSLQKLMEELKPFLLNASEKFSNIIEQGTLPPDTLRISFSLSGIKGFIEDKALNEIIQSQKDFPKMTFAFLPDKVVMSFPEKNLVISGSFFIDEGHILRFKAEEGTFYEMSLEADYIKQLFEGGGIVIELKDMLQGSTLEAMETKQGYLELSIKYNFFH